MTTPSRTPPPANTATPTIPLSETTAPNIPTPLPTLDVEEAAKIIDDFSYSNGGCRLPCWWGLPMGTATLEEANQLLSPLALASYRIVQVDTQKQVIQLTHMLPWEEEFRYWPTSILFIDKKMVELQTLPNRNLSLAQLMNEYGPPGEIWVKTTPYPLSDVLISMRLLFPQQGIFIGFSELATEQAEGQGIFVKPCFTIPIGIVLWWTELNYNFKNLEPSFSDANLVDKFLPMREAAGMDVDEFYEIYKDAEGPACIEINLEN